MRWKAAAITLAVLAVLGIGTASANYVSGSGSSAELRPGHSGLDAILQRGEVRVCSTGDYRPFTYRDPATGEWSGIDIDLARDLADRLGVRLTIVPTTWGNLLEDLGRRCDLSVGGISVTLDRARQAFYSEPYLRDGKTPITRCENAERFQTLDQIDRPGVRVIVNPGGTNERFAEDNLSQATIVRHPDNNTIFTEIIAGNADLMITDATETRWQSEQHPELCAVHPDEPFTFSEKAYLIPRGDVVLQEWIDQWLHLVRNDGTYDRIAKPWLG
ncbi:transporter substrate-binding domain-containing protein [Amycolatopsis palatopharyngis]|uniref:transporter substrate-binding domain-containing protein n=1 Tax=Amycolatopsis palatopharyngis TaxID=187982 RepID=UPI000E260F4E|nr:transporter substrate-binding domain-containing protein [Amycolatopsis palatopharyngis]